MLLKHRVTALLALLALSAGSQAFAKDSFTLYMTTNAENRYGANITVNVGSMKVEELPETLKPSSNEPVEVVIVVPKSASQEARAEFIAQIREQMRTYPNARYEIRESFVDVQADEAALKEQQAELDAMKKNIAPGSDAAKLAEKIEKGIEAGIEEDEKFERSWAKRAAGALNDTHPYNTVIAARVIALTKLSTSGFVLLSKYGINPFSMLIAGISGGISAMFGYNAKTWSEWCTSHQIPFLKDFLPVRLYNRTGWFKSATINFFRSLGISYLLRELAYLTHQTAAGKPIGSPNNWEFVAEGMGLTIPEIVLDGLLDDGARGLELKGILNHQSRSYILWVIGLIDTTMHAFFRAGSVNAAYTVAAISWGSKLALWGTSKLLSPNPKRFVFVSNDISEEKSAQITESKGFFGYLAGLGKSLYQAVANRRAGRFSVPDKQMVSQQLGLGEAWNLALSPEELEKVQMDSNLTQEEFVEILRLKDTDRALVNTLWNIRQRELGKRLHPAAVCAEALAG